jgi:hypothetical protein
VRNRIATVWRCGDDDCDCRQPQIVEFSTEQWDDPSWLPTSVIEEGPLLLLSDHGRVVEAGAMAANGR